MFDPYLYEESQVLINKLNIRNQEVFSVVNMRMKSD